MNKSRDKLRKMSVISLFAALMCIFSPISIPTGVIPVSLATFILYVMILVLGKYSVISVVIYVFIGAVGLPVFSNFTGGFEVLAGPTAGYIFGYILCAALVGIIKDRFCDKILICVLGLIIGTVVIYLLGCIGVLIYIGALNQNSAGFLLSVCIAPFIPIDVIKISVAVFTYLAMRRNKNLSAYINFTGSEKNEHKT